MLLIACITSLFEIDLPRVLDFVTIHSKCRGFQYQLSKNSATNYRAWSVCTNVKADLIMVIKVDHFGSSRFSGARCKEFEISDLHSAIKVNNLKQSL
jgi:hypothetical protein